MPGVGGTLTRINVSADKGPVMTEDSHSDEIVAGQTPEGDSVTVFDAPDEQAHHWHEGTAPEGSRIVADEYGNMVAWNGETGEVVTAMHEHDEQHPDDSVYQVSQTDLEF